VGVARAQQDDDGAVAAAPVRDEMKTLISQLGERDPVIRQRAAEELAKRADTEQLKLVDGYRVQEKNARVKVALDWALYRMGKNESLFALVRALDSAQGDQATAYLAQLDSPQPLYIFLNRTKRVAQVRLLEVLGEIGDAETLERIKPALESFEPTVAVAAEQATEQIGKRLSQPSTETQPSRPRQVGQSQDEPTP
jgi:HEAT repeat protein